MTQLCVLIHTSWWNWARRLEHDLIDVAPTPILTWLEGLDNGMVGSVEMFGRVLIFGGVTATNVSTDEALAQMYPRVASFQAILASVCTGRNLLYLIKMATCFCHSVFFFPLMLQETKLPGEDVYFIEVLKK